MSGPSAPRKRIVVAGPAEALDAWREHGESELLTLPHPRSGVPAYFLPYKRLSAHVSNGSSGSALRAPDAALTLAQKDGLLELAAVKPDAGQRAWFLGSDLESEQPSTLKIGEPPDFERVRDSVIGDGSLHMLSPVDPLFVVLPLLSSQSNKTLPFMTLEDLFERACERHTGEAAKDVDGKLDQDESWQDIIAFGETLAARAAAERICDTQDIGRGDDSKFYRLSKSKVLEVLSEKVNRLAETSAAFEQAPETLGRKLAKALDKNASASEEAQLKARRVIICDTLAPWLQDEWTVEVKRHLGVSE